MNKQPNAYAAHHKYDDSGTCTTKLHTWCKSQVLFCIETDSREAYIILRIIYAIKACFHFR